MTPGLGWRMRVDSNLKIYKARLSSKPSTLYSTAFAFSLSLLYHPLSFFSPYPSYINSNSMLSSRFPYIYIPKSTVTRL
ncbi:hypothetical protein CROQUDRAFT_386615 [Cronartium quercuum f. sp. fusiforme G11]|uniref:Uncharacterized protein n=1 Tax=Cronartium quercuum f. sp. fusiforme G11 TaxID=708437 RepID=A0A9P6NMM5_9BASI|nr:hypothetical protein CROQUDRAFT_386615 [Cronartium quercuum f. sp. fusiforme G11]